MAFGMAFLLWILYTLFAWILRITPMLFTQMTPRQHGGLLNAIFRQLHDGALRHADQHTDRDHGGIYLAEYGKNGWIANLTRFINDILLSAPSIVIGLFVYAICVARHSTTGLGGFVRAGAAGDPWWCAPPRTC